MGERGKALASTKKDHQSKEWMIHINPDDLEPVLWPQCCIYNVPENLRKLNKEVYTPQLISIGPLHHDNKKLADMENQKLIYLREFCKRTQVALKDFVSILKEDEERIRHCYSEKSELCSNNYVKMILLDAVFIIELFIRDNQKKNHQDDYMLKKLWLKNGIEQDLLLLENQLPYFVLDALFKLAFPNNYQPTSDGSSEERLTFYKLTCKYFKNYIPGGRSIRDQEKALHFTDLLRYFMSDNHPEPKESSSIKYLRSATKLYDAGMNFKGIENACLTDINFEKGKLIYCKRGKLLMSQFEVYDTTEGIIRNLMALEQCHYPSNAYICNYIVLINHLIKTAEDVDLLVEKGVIVNWIGSNEAVAKMINKLGTFIIESSFCYYDICEDLSDYYKDPYYRALQHLRSACFGNIWRGTATVVAVMLLLLTFLQTIGTFLALP